MKLRIIILSVLVTFSLSAEVAPGSKKTSAKKTATATIEPLKLPAGAVQVEPGTYSYTDANGKKWVYRQTPFGLSRAEDKPAETAPGAYRQTPFGLSRAEDKPAETAPAASNITATEAGDMIKFERPGPFGVHRWEKKKSELTDDERAAWERSRGNSAASKAKE